MRLAALLIVALPLAAGCRNRCQQICSDMAKFAEDCGHDITRAERNLCYEGQRGAESKSDRAVCREYGGVKNIEAEWTCDDVDIYWDDVADSAPEGGDEGE